LSWSDLIRCYNLNSRKSCNRDFVVIETKKGKESDKVVGQIQRYMGWINRNLAKNGKSVRGIIIVNEFDEWLDYAVSVNDNVQLKYYEVKFVVRDALSGNSVSAFPNTPTSENRTTG
jgi:RecB family endonuclease NucS